MATTMLEELIQLWDEYMLDVQWQLLTGRWRPANELLREQRIIALARRGLDQCDVEQLLKEATDHA